MPNFEAEISRTQVSLAKINFEAADAEAAEKHVLALLEKEDALTNDSNIEWTVEEDALDVEAIENLDEADEDEDDEE